MGRPRKDVGPEEATEEKTEEENSAERTEATVIYRGNRTRTYTKELHGDRFEEYAESFAAKKNGKVV